MQSHFNDGDNESILWSVTVCCGTNVNTSINYSDCYTDSNDNNDDIDNIHTIITITAIIKTR